MTSDPSDVPPVRRPIWGFIVFVLLLVALVGSFAAWQKVRWWFAPPLATAFLEQPYDNDSAGIGGPELRKFISMDLLAGGELAEAAGFDCRGLRFGANLALCYRDIWTGLCKEVWSLELIYDKDRKISKSSGLKRRVCYFD